MLQTAFWFAAAHVAVLGGMAVFTPGLFDTLHLGVKELVTNAPSLLGGVAAPVGVAPAL